VFGREDKSFTSQKRKEKCMENKSVIIISKNYVASWAQVYILVVPVTCRAKRRGWLEPRSLWPTWAIY
jgi:hypothetical protein